jgi:hypothetical protein
MRLRDARDVKENLFNVLFQSGTSSLKYLISESKTVVVALNSWWLLLPVLGNIKYCGWVTFEWMSVTEERGQGSVVVLEDFVVNWRGKKWFACVELLIGNLRVVSQYELEGQNLSCEKSLRPRICWCDKSTVFGCDVENCALDQFRYDPVKFRKIYD